MAGDETPKGQREPKPFVELRVVTWLVRAYLVWVVSVFIFIKPDPLLGVMMGLGLVGLAVIATRPADQRG